MNRQNEQTRGSETSQYPEEKTSTEIPLVVASERGSAQFLSPERGSEEKNGSRTVVERLARVGESPVGETVFFICLSSAGPEKPCANIGGPPSKAKYSQMTDSVLVPRGKGEKHPC
jgi:hypothetical protein